MDYFVTEKKEVLREVAASITAEILKYMIKHGIANDENHPLYILCQMINDLSDSIIGDMDLTIDDLEKIKAKFHFARDYARAVMNDGDFTDEKEQA